MLGWGGRAREVQLEVEKLPGALVWAMGLRRGGSTCGGALPEWRKEAAPMVLPWWGRAAIGGFGGTSGRWRTDSRARIEEGVAGGWSSTEQRRLPAMADGGLFGRVRGGWVGLL